QRRRGQPPRLADGRLPAQEGDRPQVAEPPEAGQVSLQDLAPPERAVGAESGAVEHDAEHPAGPAVLDEARGDVRVVMLHGARLDPALPGEAIRPARRA